MKTGKALKTALLLMIALLAAAALAVGTPKDTEIVNQASASFNDSAGQARITTSNQVVTVVQQVYGVSVTPNASLSGATVSAVGQSKSGIAGAVVYFNYVASNTGNGTATLTLTPSTDVTGTGLTNDFTLSSTVYHDQNCNGAVDVGETSASALSVELAADESTCSVLAATIPTASSGSGHLDLVAASSTASDSGNWAKATAVTTAAFDAKLSSSRSGTVSAGDSITYSFSGSNTGGSGAYGVTATGYVAGSNPGLVFVNDLPSGTTLSSTVSAGAGAGTVTPIYYNGTAWLTDADSPDLSTITKVGMVIARSTSNNNTSFFPQGAAYSLSYSVTVDSGLAAGSPVTNDGGTLTYGTDSSTSATVTSNSFSNTISSSYGASVLAGVANNGTYKGHTYTVSGSTQTLTGTVYSGSTVLFKNTVQNDGSASDSFNLSLSGVPAGWSCSLRQVDGATPLSGAVGPLATGNTFDFSLACTIPTTATTAQSTITVQAASVAQPSSTGSASNVVPAITSGYGVTITSNETSSVVLVDSSGATASGSIQPGATFRIPLEVENDGANPDVFDLSHSALPSGWTLLIHTDSDCDGTADDTPPTTKTGLLAASTAPQFSGDDLECFVAVGTVPAGEAPGDLTPALTFTATSTSDSGKNSEVADDSDPQVITVATVNGISFDPDRSGTVTTPGTVTYNVNLRNGGNTSQTVTVTAPASGFGWTYQISTDGGGSWSAGSGTVSVAASATKEIRVRVIVPAGQPVGRIETLAVSASDGSASDTASVATTVVGGDLTLANSGKTYTSCSESGGVWTCSGEVNANGSQAKPGEYIQYTLTATNIGTAKISEVIIMEPLPHFTQFIGVHAATSVSGAGVVYMDADSGWQTNTTGLSFAAGESVYVGINTDSTTSVSTGDELPPAATITVTLTVKVK